MNSLNIVSRLTTTPTPSPTRTRTSSAADTDDVADDHTDGSVDGENGLNFTNLSEELGSGESDSLRREDGLAPSSDADPDEKSPLLSHGGLEASGANKEGRGWQLPKRIGSAVLYGIEIVFTPITAPVRYVIACFYDENGHFSAIMPLKNLRNLMSRRKRRSVAHGPGLSSVLEETTEEKPKSQKRISSSHKRSPSVESTASTTSAASTDAEAEDSPARHTRSKTATTQPSSASVLQKKSIRIKEHSEDALRKRKSMKAKKAANADDVATIALALKSPSSPTGTSMKLTRYPRAPAPPRPLVPRRQPSHNFSFSPGTPKKTLIIDLDETLIHSLPRGGRMSTGHMVEVRINGPVTDSGLQLAPDVPVLYCVYERPGCHEFLRKVCKWYTLIVFTASIQAYADPVIDYLEREQKYFSGRYYRQHCTYRNGAFIKDLAQVEPDLSKVMILDNSPMSYIFHEDNAIPIEGWISDPTDNDLLHLIPLLEGLQYVTDVRALLALKQGQQAQQA